MHCNLISSIELLSDDKSVRFGIDNALDHLWLLSQFKHLEITDKKILYQDTPSYRARKGTVYKSHWLKRKCSNTSELLDYLRPKWYRFQYFEVMFNNNWKVKIESNIFLTVNTNSIEERNHVIEKFMIVAGLPVLDVSVLKINYTYLLSYTSPPDDHGWGINPDEFWDPERRANWIKEITKEQDNETTEIEGEPF